MVVKGLLKGLPLRARRGRAVEHCGAEANEALCAVLKAEMAHWGKAGDAGDRELFCFECFKMSFVYFVSCQWQVLGIAALTDDTGSFGYLPLASSSWKELMFDASSRRMTILRVLTPEEITKGKWQFAGAARCAAPRFVLRFFSLSDVIVLLSYFVSFLFLVLLQGRKKAVKSSW